MKTVRITYLTMWNGKQGETCFETQMDEEHVRMICYSLEHNVCQRGVIEHLLEAHEQVCGRTYIRDSVYSLEVLCEA